MDYFEKIKPISAEISSTRDDELISKKKVVDTIETFSSELAREGVSVPMDEAFKLVLRSVQHMHGYKTADEAVSRADVYKMFRAFALRNDSSTPDSEIERLVNELPPFRK